MPQPKLLYFELTAEGLFHLKYSGGDYIVRRNKTQLGVVRDIRLEEAKEDIPAKLAQDIVKASDIMILMLSTQLSITVISKYAGRLCAHRAAEGRFCGFTHCNQFASNYRAVIRCSLRDYSRCSSII